MIVLPIGYNPVYKKYGKVSHIEYMWENDMLVSVEYPTMIHGLEALMASGLSKYEAERMLKVG